MSRLPDYYLALGLLPGATEQEIKGAYRRLAMVHHPDRQGDPVKFKQISEAADVLTDEEKRRDYDKQRANALVEDVSESARSVVEDYFRQFELS